MMRAPSSAWSRISDHSGAVRPPGLRRIASGIASLPMSWKSAAWPRTSSSACESPSCRADRERELLHAPRVARRVRVACVDGRRERLHRLGRALLQEPVRLLERHVLRLDRLGRRAQVARRPLRVREVRLLRLAHQQDGHGEDHEGVEARRRRRRSRSRRRRSRRRGSAAGAARSARGTPSAPGRSSPAAADERVEARVDGEVDDARDDAGARDHERASADEGEDSRSGERGERDGAGVEDQLPQLQAPGAPVRGYGRDRDHERGSRAEERRAGERADDGDRDPAFVDVQRQRLAAADERDDHDEPEQVVADARAGRPRCPPPRR